MPLYSQMVGNPSAVQGANAWSMSASMGYLRHQEGTYENRTERIVLKSRYAVTSWMDIYGLMGGYKLRRLIDSNTIDDYTGEYSLGYGAGLNISKNQFLGSLTGWLSGHFVRFPSKGEYMENFVAGGGWMNSIEYDSREYQFFGGIKFPVQNWRIYVGGGIWGIQRLEEQKIYLVNSDGTQSNIPYQVNDGTYQSSAWTGGLLGFEVNLPQQFTLGVEGMYFNNKNFQIMFGISQTVGGKW